METKVFQDIVHLLQGADWLYNYPMTQVFTRNIFSHMPVEWQKALVDLPLDALNGLSQCLTLQHWPSSLKMFLQECQRLSYLSQDLGPKTSGSSSSSSIHNNSSSISSSDGTINSNTSLQIPQELTREICAKKKYEITTLLSVVKEMLDITGSKHILDIGSGKGYIDTCIHRILHAQVLGIEGNSKLMRSAEKHHWKLYGRCRGITFLNWHLSDSKETLCRAEQLVSHLTELDTSCSCQTSTRSRTFSAKKTNRTDSLCNTDARKSPVVCEENIPSNIDTLHSLTNSDSSVRDSKDCPQNMCLLLGLHACADLSPIAMKMFRDCDQASSLVLLSCCYHKMSLRPKPADEPMSNVHKPKHCLAMHAECSSGGDASQNEQEEIISEESDFLNFPMSQSLQEVFRRNNFHMSIFGLRLGAEKNLCAKSPEEHEHHMRHVAYRGVLEAACVKENINLRKLRRRCVRKSGFGDFSEYKKNVFKNYEFENVGYDVTSNKPVSSTEKEFDKNEDEILKRNMHMSDILDSCYESYKHYFPLIEPLTGLQLALQPVIEVMVQMDRLIYLKECGFSKVWLEKVFDAEISPRNIALLAIR